MKKICLLGYMKVHGGIQRNIVNISNYLCNSYEIYIVNLDEECEIPYSLNEKVHVISLNVNNHWQEFLGLWKAFSKVKPDVVIGFWLLNAIWSAIIKVRFNYKCIYSERNDPSNHEYGLILKIARCIGFYFIDLFVFQHRKARDFFGKGVLNRSFVIANAIELNNVAAKDCYKDTVKNFITVGRLHEQKNQSLMLDALASLIQENEEFRDITLDIYGDGRLREDLQNKIDGYGLTDNVHIHNAQSGIFEVMKGADAFLLTSNYEGMPNVLIEAMSLGLPCVSTDYSCGGVDEIIENGINGLIVDANNVEQLKNAIKMLYENPEKAREMGQQAKKIKEKHMPDYIMRKWEKMLDDVTR